MPRNYALLAVLTAFLTLVHLSPAKAELNSCTEITALPFTITVQGVYCLKKNLNVNLTATNSAAITINAGNVTIDFNGFRVNNQAPSTNLAFGVYAADRKNITLRNGFIRGFYAGIFLAEIVADSSASHLVEAMKIADSGIYGVFVHGDKTVLRDNRIIDTGNGPANFAYGIYLLNADDGLIAGNIISGISEVTQSFGIVIETSIRIRVIGNEVTDVNNSGDDRGIIVSLVDYAIIADNRLLNNPAAGFGGISDFGGSTSISCLDNTVAGYVTALLGCDVNLRNDVLYN